MAARRRLLTLAVLAGIALGGCGGSDGPARTVTVRASATPDPQVLEVSRETYRGRWPLTVDAGELRCEPGAGDTVTVTFLAPDGTAYPVNDFTDADASIRRIWNEGVTLLPLLETALKVCDRAGS